MKNIKLKRTLNLKCEDIATDRLVISDSGGLYEFRWWLSSGVVTRLVTYKEYDRMMNRIWETQRIGNSWTIKVSAHIWLKWDGEHRWTFSYNVQNTQHAVVVDDRKFRQLLAERAAAPPAPPVYKPNVIYVHPATDDGWRTTYYRWYSAEQSMVICKSSGKIPVHNRFGGNRGPTKSGLVRGFVEFREIPRGLFGVPK